MTQVHWVIFHHNFQSFPSLGRTITMDYPSNNVLVPCTRCWEFQVNWSHSSNRRYNSQSNNDSVSIISNYVGRSNKHSSHKIDGIHTYFTTRFTFNVALQQQSCSIQLTVRRHNSTWRHTLTFLSFEVRFHYTPPHWLPRSKYWQSFTKIEEKWPKVVNIIALLQILHCLLSPLPSRQSPWLPSGS